MLCSLAGGESRPASELALVANVSPQTASRHLSLLTGSGLLEATSVGRNKFYRLRRPAIARVLERLAGISNDIGPAPGIADRRAPELVFARVCYDHLAGVLGVAICDRALSSKHLRLHAGDLQLTGAGAAFFRSLGIGVQSIANQRRRFAYPCPDWSQRVPHIGGTLGAALLDWLISSGAVVRSRDSRAVRVTGRGMRLLERVFGIRLSRTGTAIAALKDAGATGVRTAG